MAKHYLKLGLLTFFIFIILLVTVRFAPELAVRLIFNEVSIAVVVSLFVTFISVIQYHHRLIKRKAQERVENYLQGAFREKLIHRPLEEWEKLVLENKYRETKEKDFDLDRRSPVFRIQGNLVRLGSVNTQAVKIPEEWSVRGFKINENNYPDIRYKAFKDGEEIQVEFSPFSKYVWDVFKITNNQRDWLLSLDKESFDLLKAELIKVVPRAPFGNHNISKMREEDLITFSQFLSGERKEVEINYVKHYNSLEELLDKEGLVNVFPKVKTNQEAVQILNSHTNYSDRINKGGVYAIGINYLS